MGFSKFMTGKSRCNSFFLTGSIILFFTAVLPHSAVGSKKTNIENNVLIRTLFIIFLVFDTKISNLLKTKQQPNPTKEQRTSHSYLYHSIPTTQIQNFLQINQMTGEQKNQKPRLKRNLDWLIYS